MRLDDMVTLIRTIDMLDMVGLKPTRHAIAKNIKSVSRSTVYRRINKMIEYKLLELVVTKDGTLIARATANGNGLMASSRELWT